MPSPPNSPGSNQLGTIAFSTGLSTSGTLSAMNGWTWAGTNPATYGGNGQSAHKWEGGFAGTSGGTVGYYFDPGSNFSAGVEAMYVSALTLWSDEANIDFVQTTNPNQAQLSFYLFNSSTPNVPLDNGAYATAVYQGGSPGNTSIPATQAASISIEQTGGWAQLDSFTYAGGEGPATIVHELGHTLGLMHTGPYNGDVNAATQQYNTTDMYLWSIMSYIRPSETDAKYYTQYPVQGTNYNTQDTPITPQMLDILAAQQLYGLPTSRTLSGGQIFGFHTNITDAAAPFFDFTKNTDPVVTIWDSGINNTLDLSGFYTPSVVNLNPGTFSSADGMTNNIGIGYYTAIDTAIGGAGNDTFTVNADSDTINGGGGTNTAIFSGACASYVITAVGAGTYTVSNGAAIDTLSDIQTLTFADQSVAVSALPVGDTFSWHVGSGAYSDQTNWTNVTQDAPATSPPGPDDIALLPGPTSGGPQTISGNGAAAQMVFTGLAGVTGDLTPGLLTVGQGGGQTATLTIAPGATIAATSAAVANGTLLINGTLTTASTLTLSPADAASTSSVQARSGGFVQVGSLALNGGTVSVDDTSSFEVGTVGGAEAGEVTIDPGSTLSGNGSLSSVADGGTILATGGILGVDSLTGTGGQVSIAPGAILSLGSNTTIPITFAAGSATLALTTPPNELRTLGAINNFNTSDLISITALNKNKPQPLLQPTYDSTTGVLTTEVSGGGIGVSGTLEGSYSGYVFVLQPTGTGVFGLITALGTLGGSTVPSAGTSAGATFVWSAGASGDWNTVANWSEQDAAEEAEAVAPGARDSAVIQGTNQPNTVQVISGAGDTGNLLFAGANAISSTITVGGAVTIGQIGNPASLALIGDAKLSANTAMLIGGMLDVASGTSLSVTNGLSIVSTVGQSVAPLEIYGGGSVQVGSLTLVGALAPIALDSASILEVGTVGDAQAGFLTVDTVNIVSGSGDLSRIAVNDAGTVIASGGSLGVGAVSGKGMLAIGPNATLALAASETNPISFTGPAATLLVTNTDATLGTVSNFVQGETFAVSALPQALPTSVTYTNTGLHVGTLSLTNQFGTKITATLDGDYTGANFVLSPGSSPAVVDVTIACFAEGTRITTANGPVAVEQLREGDLVSVHFAPTPLPVAWIGHRHIDCRRHPDPRRVRPVRIQAGSFGPYAPSRDLLLSPDHAVLVDDKLIPVKYLLNGTSIAQIEMDTVSYYHVELVHHDVVFAEGLPAESYLDTGDRAKFANGGVVVMAHPDFATRLWEAVGCAPMVVTGPALEATRQHLGRGRQAA